MSWLDPFRNRLNKTRRHWDKWARRRGITCYRIYDRDLPEFPLAIDRYEQQLHMQLFQRRQSEWDEAQEQQLIQATAELLAMAPESISFKSRRRQTGRSQYQKVSDAGDRFRVREAGLEFLVDLRSYLDTGLFLDHRQTRQMVRERAAGRRFLNLFAYTGSFTVHAAAGGAESSLTVDISNSYQQWSRDNFRLNGMDLKRHRLQREDVFRYLQQARSKRQRFDLIVMDPPSFSNSKKMRGVLDVQRDHRQLIEQCLELLAPQGELFFSNNLRRFRMNSELERQPWVREITSKTVPEDFRRHRPHRCWLITP